MENSSIFEESTVPDYQTFLNELNKFTIERTWWQRLCRSAASCFCSTVDEPARVVHVDNICQGLKENGKKVGWWCVDVAEYLRVYADQLPHLPVMTMSELEVGGPLSSVLIKRYLDCIDDFCKNNFIENSKWWFFYEKDVVLEPISLKLDAPTTFQMEPISVTGDKIEYFSSHLGPRFFITLANKVRALYMKKASRLTLALEIGPNVYAIHERFFQSGECVCDPIPVNLESMLTQIETEYYQTTPS